MENAKQGDIISPKEEQRNIPKSPLAKLNGLLHLFGIGKQRKQEMISSSTVDAQKTTNSTEYKSQGSVEVVGNPLEQEQILTPVSDIAGFLVERLKKEKDITPPEIGEFRGVIGTPAGTNEQTSKGFFEAIKEKKPDGYIIGVGSGNIYRVLESFSEGSPPKGMVLIDIDPRVIAIGKLLIDAIKQSETSEDLINNFFRLPSDQFQEHIKKVVDKEENEILKERIQKIKSEDWDEIVRMIRHRSEEAVEIRDSQSRTSGSDIEKYTNDIIILLDNFTILKELAKRNNIAMIYSDFTNPTLVAAVMELPDFKESRNIVYVSNIVDHITDRGREFENVSKMDSLKAYEELARKPIFLDTLAVKLSYFLRARHSMPTYTMDDFKYRQVADRSQAPTGLIFEDE